ncbi:MAG TPA: DUF3667 domain-containing protein [Steroidobacteraceae bacterium]|nr:DUF3667 domain-containing protein [Steroidobacteraceae bacterium]
MNDASARPTHCANCGASLADRYCGRCGQDSHASLSFGDFVHELLEGLFHVDSKFWLTLRTLLARPGLLTEQYLAGKRLTYSPPFRSYLVISIVYFVLASLLAPSGSRVLGENGQELTAADCAKMAAHPGWALRFVPDIAGSCERALSNNARALTSAMENLLPKVMFVVLPLVALVQFWIFRRQRPMYLENLVFVLHFQSFYYLASVLALLVAGVSALAGAKDAVSQALELVVYAWSIVYLFIAERRVYRASALKIVLGLLAVTVSYIIFYSLGVSVAGMYAFLRA